MLPELSKQPFQLAEWLLHGLEDDIHAIVVSGIEEFCVLLLFSLWARRLNVLRSTFR